MGAQQSDADISKGIALCNFYVPSPMLGCAELLDPGIQSEGRPDVGNGSKPRSRHVKPPASELSCPVPVSVQYMSASTAAGVFATPLTTKTLTQSAWRSQPNTKLPV